MPLREYKCLRCGGKIEVIDQGPRQSLVAILEWCGCEDEKIEAEEVLCSPAIRFKGAGFHTNDYGKGPRYTVSSRAKKRYRQEIRDARERGEI